MLRVLARPKWIAVLLLALAAASVFAALGRWQLEAAIRSAQPYRPDPGLEQAVPLGEALRPLEPVTEERLGQRVRMRGVLDPRDFELVPGRLQGEREGYWVLGHLVVTDDGSVDHLAAEPEAEAGRLPGLVLALGWAPDEGSARRAAERLAAESDGAAAREWTGRLQLGQAPERPRAGDPGRPLTVAPAQLVNRWASPPERPYAAYAILEPAGPAPAGLEAIEVRPAVDSAGVNWLNVFYAIEWIVFAVFAVVMWWRLARDEFERERAAPRGARERLTAEVRAERLRALRERRSAHGAGGGGGS
ncbi:MAG: SURF1 family cytochrome oxidase biogenesis protein [Pseudoclavibacter sp.]|nr:SURF1 family cytochrome oxidase biogenesis protein [Pseudoclavibacter sp.]